MFGRMTSVPSIISLAVLASPAAASDTVTAIVPEEAAAARVDGQIWQYRIIPADWDERVDDPDAFDDPAADPQSRRERVRSGAIRVANNAIYAVPGRDGNPPLGGELVVSGSDDEDETRKNEDASETVRGDGPDVVAVIDNDDVEHPREMVRIGDVERMTLDSSTRYIFKFGPRAATPGRGVLTVRNIPADGVLVGYFIEPHDPDEKFRLEMRFVSE